MPNGSTECDLSCQTKIILNSGNIAGISTANNQCLLSFINAGGKIQNGHKIIALLNKIEDDVVAAQKLIAESLGYDGPTGKMLEDDQK